jgi:hypothetical protein
LLKLNSFKATHMTYRTATTNTFFGEVGSPAGGRQKKFVSYIPFLIWVDLVSGLHAIRFTRLHETKLCLRLRACRQVCKFIVGLSKRLVTARAATPTHVAPTHVVPLNVAAVPRATFILLATTQHPCPAARPATTDSARGMG